MTEPHRHGQYEQLLAQQSELLSKAVAELKSLRQFIEKELVPKLTELESNIEELARSLGGGTPEDSAADAFYGDEDAETQALRERLDHPEN